MTRSNTFDKDETGGEDNRVEKRAVGSNSKNPETVDVPTNFLNDLMKKVDYLTKVQREQQKEKAKVIEPYVKILNIVKRRLIIGEEGETGETHSEIVHGSRSL